MNEIKNIWGNGKTRGIIFIIFYIILFAYIFTVYGKRNEKIILPDNVPQKVEKTVYNSYEYEYITSEDTVNVKKYNDVVEFKILDLDYYYINDKCYRLENEKFVGAENPLKYNFDYLNNLDEIKKISFLVKTTTYTDGLKEENYNINTSQLLEIFNIFEDVDNKEITNYSLFINNEKIEKIVFTNLDLTIKYTNFENISEINTNYEFYNGELEPQN